MPRTTDITLSADDLRVFKFNLARNRSKVELELSTAGRLRVLDLSSDKYSEPDRLFYRNARTLSIRLENADNRQLLIKSLQSKVAERRLALGDTRIERIPNLLPRAADPFDCYYVKTSTQLPISFSQMVLMINTFMLLMASMLLLPSLADSQYGLPIAIAFSGVAALAQLNSRVLQRRLGVERNRRIQDFFLGGALTVSTFTSVHVGSDLLLNRGLQLLNIDQQDKYANLITGSISLTLAAGGSIAAWFRPAINVTGPSVQAEAIRLVHKCREKHLSGNIAFRTQIVEEFKENAGKPLAYRFFCPSRKLSGSDHYRRDERMINYPSLITVGSRLGGALVRSAQFSLALGLNPEIAASILLPLVVFGFIYAFVNREITVPIRAGREPLFTIPALSTKAPTFAKGLKWSSELCNVAYNSGINPIIAFFFVFQLLFKGKPHDSYVAVDFITPLALAVFLNILSMIIDLSSRDLGLDRFEGWSASRLRYLMEEGQKLAMRENLARYLQLVFDSVHYNIPLEEVETSLEDGAAAGDGEVRLSVA